MYQQPHFRQFDSIYKDINICVGKVALKLLIKRMVKLYLLYYTTNTGNSSATFRTVFRDKHYDLIISIIAKIENNINIIIFIV
jgi:hypothetical protein